ncbi:hypothetical protein CERZMDRAFT_102668 [Cercospora zeae-maydis SCOH1-5]|uniref:Uncharacterized protein n=1 Tax=Cercospora zeae-maydis SCOH1-5 TaxID=717836 RepID=A0A6A6F167_9PEZI|nr:hypothetical protein CERZMDRAFT_102668 [Cercospora zeae-maydis SCOH1-5]
MSSDSIRPNCTATVPRRTELCCECEDDAQINDPSILCAGERRAQVHQKQQHWHCMSRHDFRPSWWGAIAAVLESDVLPLMVVMSRERPASLPPMNSAMVRHGGTQFPTANVVAQTEWWKHSTSIKYQPEPKPV